MKPSALLTESRVVLGIGGAASKEKVLRRLLEVAFRGVPGDFDGVLRDVLDREASMTTGIGFGVAIPHAHSAHVRSSTAALGISEKGLDWDAVDGEPVHIVFACVMPDGDPGGYVRTLADIAALLGREDVRKAIVAAPGPREVLDIVKANER